MGFCEKGQWVCDSHLATTNKRGEFKRMDSPFRDTIAIDHPRFQPEKNRYHLYVSAACPWAHRTVIFRQIKQLKKIISLSHVDAVVLDQGWGFNPKNKKLRDPLHNFDYLHQLYTLADPLFTGRATVPVLWDKKEKTIVNNESSEIIRIFNQAFDSLTNNTDDYYPTKWHSKIDSINNQVYQAINNGVYQCGFASTQKAYEASFYQLFKTLDWIDKKLIKQNFLVGKQLTEADWRLFTTLIRFDAVYYGHFKCNLKRIRDYEGLSAFIERLYGINGIKQTIDMEAIKNHYYQSHRWINPTGIVPKGPELPWLK